MSETRLHGPERLRVYHLALKLVALVDRIAEDRSIARSILDQLRRAAESVVLNIAEGAGHFSPGRKIACYQIARGSAAECAAALTILKQRHSSPLIDEARRTANMICTMLTSLIHRQEKRRTP